jgi:hypothetical protein
MISGRTDAILTTCVLILTVLILYWMGTLESEIIDPRGVIL